MNLLWLEHSILLSQDMPHSTQSVSVFGNQCQSTSSISAPSTVANITKPYKADRKRSISRVSSTRMIPQSKVNSLDWNSSIFWSQPQFRTSSAAINLTPSLEMRNSNGRSSQSRHQYSWMTPIRLLPLLNCWGSCWTNKDWIKKLHGRLSMILSRTLTIPCCLKHWRSGVLISWVDYYPGTWNWFIWSTSSGCRKSWKNYQKKNMENSTNSRLLSKASPKELEWQIFVLLDRIRSMV